jgi:hypothetical protein
MLLQTSPLKSLCESVWACRVVARQSEEGSVANQRKTSWHESQKLRNNPDGTVLF